jgi:hypothetical protein
MNMRILLAAATCLLTLLLTGFAVAETARRPDPPKISETQDPEKKSEYLESIPYKPCPASVVLANGRHACIGLPGDPDSNNLHDRQNPAADFVH